jgi:hypothetical protein
VTPKPYETSGGRKLYDHALLLSYHRGVAALAGIVHLMISNLGQKGGAWPHPKQHHPVPQGPPFSSIDWPPEVHRQSHLNHTASSRPKHTTASRPCCHTAPQDQELTSFPLGAEQHHPIATISTSHHCPALQYRCTLPH